MARHRDPFDDAYLRRIGDHPLLTAEQEQKLVLRAQAGNRKANRKARDEMVRCNMKLVMAFIKKYGKRCAFLDLHDLLQEGVKGLLDAIEKFDVEKGYRFSTYATWHIRNHVFRALRNHSRPIRIPASQHETVSQAITKLKKKLGREPLVSEVAKAVKQPEAVVKMSFRYRLTSLDAGPRSPAGGDLDITLGSFIKAQGPSPSDHAIHVDQVANVGNLLVVLTPIQRLIIERRFGLDGKEPQTLEQVGVKVKLTRERVRQIQEKALEKLRKVCEKDNLFQDEVA